jgi:hypothetical protein
MLIFLCDTRITFNVRDCAVSAANYANGLVYFRIVNTFNLSSSYICYIHQLRLLLKLVPKKSHAYVNDYHYHLQAAIYSLIREGRLPDVHEKKGYKFFCFSNIFPYGDFEQGKEMNLLVSSPDIRIID